MSKPWEAYGAPRTATVYSDGQGVGADGEEFKVDENGSEVDPGLQVTVTDDGQPAEAPDAPPSEMAAQSHAPVAGQPWAEFGTATPGGEDPGLTGEVHAEHFVDDNGNPVDEHGKPLGGPPEEAPGVIETMFEGLKGGGLSGFADEARGVGGGIGSLLSGRGFSSGYDAESQKGRDVSDAAWNNNPWAYAAGYVPGMAINAFLTRGRGAPAETLMGRLGQAGMEGGKQGLLTGAGHGDGLGGKLMGALEGGVGGALLGPLLYPVGAAAQNVGSRIAALFPKMGGNALNSGLDTLAARAPQSEAAMRAEAQRFNDAGVAPRLADVVDESGRGVIRDAATKMTPARQEVVAHAKAVRGSAQDDVATLANAHISDSPQTARQVASNLSEGRGTAMDANIAPVRNEPVPLNDEVKSILSTREGQAALRGAEGLMTDPADRALARQLQAAARKAAKGVPPVDDILRKEVPGWDDMPQVIKDAYLKQRPDLLQQADPYEGIHLTVDMADKFARAMKGRAASTPGLERVANAFGNAVRGTAKDANETYAGAVDDYAARSGVIDAASGEGKFANSKFLATPQDAYAATVAKAAPNAPEGVDMSELAAMRARARDDVVDQATSGAGQHAPAVARTLGYGRGQEGRSTALLGQEGADRLRDGARVLDSRYEHTGYIDPNMGSKTAGVAQDAIVDGFAQAAANLASGGKWGIARTAAKWLQQGGIRGVDAERLARDAISDDPARLEAAINHLVQKGMVRSRAQRFVSIYGSVLGGRAAGTAAGDN